MLNQIMFVIFALQLTNAFSQTQLEKDNRALDNLTQSFKTFQIIVVVNDTISRDESNDNIKHEIIKHFNFLKQKQISRKKPDFEIRVDINANLMGTHSHSVMANSEPIVFGDRGDQYYTHNYLIDHYLKNASIAVHVKEKNIYNISLDTASIIERKYSYKEWHREYASLSFQRRIDAQQRERDNADRSKKESNVIYRFEPDFFYAFKKYLTK
jgi:hypothetical protein